LKRSIAFTANDGSNNSEPATTELEIIAVNDNPQLAANNGLWVDENAAAKIDHSALWVTDVDNTTEELTFTISGPPLHGSLYREGSPTTSFTQQDINDGQIEYVHDGSETTHDSFTFDVSDGAGGSIEAREFTIAVSPVNDAPVAVATRPARERTRPLRSTCSTTIPTPKTIR
jgi:VCBS repeat-containing protein